MRIAGMSEFMSSNSLQRNYYHKQTRKLWTFLVMTFLTIFSKDKIYFMLFIVVIRASPHGINKKVHQEYSIPLVGVCKTCGLLLRISNTYNGKLYQVIMGACEWAAFIEGSFTKGWACREATLHMHTLLTFTHNFLFSLDNFCCS